MKSITLAALMATMFIAGCSDSSKKEQQAKGAVTTGDKNLSRKSAPEPSASQFSLAVVPGKTKGHPEKHCNDPLTDFKRGQPIPPSNLRISDLKLMLIEPQMGEARDNNGSLVISLKGRFGIESSTQNSVVEVLISKSYTPEHNASGALTGYLCDEVHSYHLVRTDIANSEQMAMIDYNATSDRCDLQGIYYRYGTPTEEECQNALTQEIVNIASIDTGANDVFRKLDPEMVKTFKPHPVTPADSIQKTPVVHAEEIRTDD